MRPSRAALIVAVSVLLVAVAIAVLSWPSGRSVGEPPERLGSVPSSTTPSPILSTPILQPPAVQAPSSAPPGVPVRVTVARVGIDSALEPLGLLADGSLESPAKWAEAGWYARGIRPGAVGPAVIAGHVDSTEGPAVFYRLRELRPGDGIAVRDATGAVRTFTVTDVKEYPKDRFPTASVYGPTVLPVLRLVTCTGDFDHTARSYLDNLVVSAVLTQPRAA